MSVGHRRRALNYASSALELFGPYREEWAALVRAPQKLEVVGLESEQCAGEYGGVGQRAQGERCGGSWLL
jgi:hypothetical protein